MRDEAARAERFAGRAQLMLDEPKATRLMQALSRRLYESAHTGLLLERALEGAMSLIGGALGNVQVCARPDRGLRIAAQSGFSSEFLDYFAIVDDDTSACGRAASQRSQTVIVDVSEDAEFAPHREIAAAARFRAVQSTPAVDPTGRLRAVISTHYRRPHQPSDRDLQLVHWYAEHVGAALAQMTNRGAQRASAAIQVLDRARQERERAQALAERAQTGRRYRGAEPSSSKSSGS